MKNATPNKRSFGHRIAGANKGSTQYVRIDERLARFAPDDRLLNRAPSAKSIAEAARIAALKSASAPRIVQEEPRIAVCVEIVAPEVQQKAGGPPSIVLRSVRYPA